MNRRPSRKPRVGDLIVEKCPNSLKEHIGIVYEIQLDSYHHQRHVLIHWQRNRQPRNYHEKYGYSGVNIHNLRDRYRIVREGKEIR